MTTGAELRIELDGVVSPARAGYAVRPVPTAPGYSIGRGADGIVVLLTPPDLQPDPPTSLRSLTLEPRVRCRIEGTHGDLEEDRGLIELRLTDQEMLDPFLAVGAALIRLLGPSPAPGQVSSAMRRLVKIFDRNEPARGSVLGIFGELVVIANSSDPGTLVDSWHSRVDARFDFAAQGSRLEVKTTTRDTRQHTFGLQQLKPVSGALVRIASIMTTETGAGTSVGQLVDKVEQLLAGDADRQVTVHQQVAATLGNEWVRYLSNTFDEVQAVRTLAVLDPTNIPQVEEPPPGVLSVQLTVDCSDVPLDSRPAGLAALIASPGETTN